jgi:hypothetical protein
MILATTNKLHMTVPLLGKDADFLSERGQERQRERDRGQEREVKETKGEGNRGQCIIFNLLWLLCMSKLSPGRVSPSA